MVRDRRVTDNPLAHLPRMNVKTDRRHDRRALSVDELRRLLQAAETGPNRQGRKKNGQPSWHMSGLQRAALYHLAMETGLRSSELRSLTKASFDFDSDPPTVTVEAAYSKRKRRDVMPLRRETADVLRPFLATLTPATPVFKMPSKHHVAGLLLKPDLEAARQQWLIESSDDAERNQRDKSDYLAYVDHAGRYADFHALRHSFITQLGRTGTHFKTQQDLARHSTPVLTARYTHGFRGDEVAAINELPNLAPTTRKNQRATGTDGRDCLASCLASEGGLDEISMDSGRPHRPVSENDVSIGSTKANVLESRDNHTCGGVAERLNAPVLKTGRGFVPLVGSNPTPTASFRGETRFPRVFSRFLAGV